MTSEYMEALPGVPTWIRRDRLEEMERFYAGLFSWAFMVGFSIEYGHPTTWTFPC